MTKKGNWDAEGFMKALERAVVAKGCSWKQVSNETGVSQSTLSRMQAGRHPDAASLAALSAWCGLNPAEFMLKESSPEPSMTLQERLRSTPNWMRESFEHWKDATLTYDRAPFDAADRIDALERENAALREAADDAATSLETISRLSGKAAYIGDDGEHIPTYMGHHHEVRAYAAARASVARSAIAALDKTLGEKP